MAGTQQAPADTFIKLNQEEKKAVLVTDTNKKKYMKCSRNEVKEQLMDLGGNEIGNSQSFKYLDQR